MKKFLAIAMMALCATAFADVGSGSGAGSSQNTSTASTATGTATNAGNSQNITFTSPAASTSTATVNGDTTQHIDYGTQVIKNTPSVSASPLVSSNDTCMGSASGAINGPGFGIGLGKTYTDTNCVMLKNAREMWNMGMRGAAMARMCMDADNKDALEMTGFVCPQTTRDKQKTQQAAAAPQDQYTDPLVRARLGLAPLAQ